MWFPIGPSSYPTHKGAIQFVNSKRIADQFLSMKRDFDAMKAAAGSLDRLSPNEAKRSRPDQDRLWADFVSGRSPVRAAQPYTSRHDEVTHGNAIDVGVTMGNGENRALTPAEFDWMHANAEQRGFTWTGRWFNEPWHIEGATQPEKVPPYPDIVAGGDSVIISDIPPTTPVGEIVNTHIVHIDNRKGAYDAYLVNPDTMRILHLTSQTQENYWINKGVDLQSGTQAPQIIANFEKVGK